ncbi:hypothetical protein ADUPG1_003739 [Aduncisulcus paluster]|uniref:Uncharacterized protein n=1 Tax=Aduncisulcus paluster TaxID=2918883 RepID=A0ABQ5L0I7_9EUKA|nr:hypothetical protein ADUPG1_003739 [Aduncisulcus paluster]
MTTMAVVAAPQTINDLAIMRLSPLVSIAVGVTGPWAEPSYSTPTVTSVDLMNTVAAWPTVSPSRIFTMAITVPTFTSVIVPVS